ncbi:MAG: OmpH family outer membrane protein [Cytophagales bacterium]|nr:OmpH family outer membrane protein [Cytophagales bacterium]
MIRSFKPFIGYPLCIVCIIYGFSPMLYAQKFGYVNSQYILNQLPEYEAAIARLDTLSSQWRENIKTLYTDIEYMRTELASEDVLLTRAMREEREKEIAEQVKEAQELQDKTFGYEGLYFLKRAELTQNIQDRVFEAIEKTAKKHKLQIVFDKSGELVMLYTNPVHDYTDFVLEEMGLLKKRAEKKKRYEKQKKDKESNERNSNTPPPPSR